MIAKLIGLLPGSKTLSSPGIRNNPEDEEELLCSLDSTKYRAIVARANYLAQDRFDIQFAVKELSRTMSSPTTGCWTALKRLGRYLLSISRVALVFNYQEKYKHVDVWTDSDWAGDRSERKSTSGVLFD